MNTTAAALEANVTVATIRTWCRRGVIAATKQAGRWIIDTASLAHRITIGQRKARMTTTYRIDQTVEHRYGKDRTVYTIVRTDGTPAGYGPGQDSRIYDATFVSRNLADFYYAFYENTPEGFRIKKALPRTGRMNQTTYWVVTGSTDGDPKELDRRIDADRDESELSTVDILIQWVAQHVAGAPERIQAAAEKAAIDAAETAVREAREQQLAELARTKGALATPRQIDYILNLLEGRRRTGEGGGFYTGPTTRARLEEMSKGEASTYITSLKGDY